MGLCILADANIMQGKPFFATVEQILRIAVMLDARIGLDGEKRVIHDYEHARDLFIVGEWRDRLLILIARNARISTHNF